MTKIARCAVLAVLLLGLAQIASAADLPVRKDAPSVAITFPSPNATLSTQLTPTITLQATASDPDEAPSGVTFFLCPASGGSCATTPEPVSAAGSSPFKAAWTPPPPFVYSASGTSTPYLVWAVVWNSLGQAGASSTIAFTLLQPASQPRVTLIVPNEIEDMVLEFVTPAAPVLYATAIPDNTTPPSSIVRVDFLDGSTVIGSVTAPNTVPGGYAFIWSDPALGAHLISARAFDSLGNWAMSTAMPIYIVDPDQPPQVSLTAPASGQIFTSTSSVPLAATASVSQGWVERVEFTAGATVIGSATSAPYAASWVNPPPGHFAITAIAYDDLGFAAASPAAHIDVLAAPRTPAVVLTAPAPGTVITAGVALPFAATALAPDGSISRVDFLAGSNVIGSAASAPYAYTWSNPTVGSFALTAKAYDLQGHSGTSTPVAVTVLSNTPRPAVTLSSPAGGTTFAAPGAVRMDASATPVGGASIAKVEFLANGSLVGTRTVAPYSYTWSNVSVGNYSLSARATDNFGAFASSSAVSVSVVNDAPPSVTLTAPSNGQTFYYGAPIALSATASDSDGTVAKVEFLSDGAVIASSSSSPYGFTWNGAVVGTHTISARATDNLGATTTSASATITVAANNPPTVSLTAPSPGQAFAFGAPITVTASASDSDGTIAKVELIADGVVIGTITTSPYTMSWSGAAIGAHTLSARATDNRGAPTTSAAIGITVTPSSTPTVSLAMPRTNQSFAAGATVNLAASAADAGGTLVRVEFYAGATLIGTVTSAPYNFAWTNVPAGNYVLTAKAIDNQTATAASSGIPIQVITPALTIMSPAANASIAADFVLVQGTYEAPPNSGVTVNGVVANNDGQGNYFVNNLPLVPGDNTLTVVLTTADRQTVTQTQIVTSTGTAPMQISADPDSDFAPSTYTILLENRTDNAYTNISYQNLGGGQLDVSTVDQTTLGKITYTTPGTYMPQFVITDSAGNTYTQTISILVRDKSVMDAMLKSLWQDFTTALATRDAGLPLTFLSSAAHVRYQPILTQLADEMPAIVASMGSPQTGALDIEIAEFVVRRVQNGVKRLYFIYLLRDNEGIWHIDSM